MEPAYSQGPSLSVNSKEDNPAGTFDFSLVIPVYLNEENIPDLLDAVDSLEKRLNGTLEIVFVVDGSPDRSYVLLEDARAGARCACA